MVSSVFLTDIMEAKGRFVNEILQFSKKESTFTQIQFSQSLYNLPPKSQIPYLLLRC